MTMLKINASNLKTWRCQNSARLFSDSLKLLMQQHGLGIADVPEIGSNTLVSKVINRKRNLTRNHIEALSKRFGVSPALFF